MPLKKGVCMSRSLNRNMTRDLTEGSPMKLMIRFALPLLLGMLFQQFYSFVDTAIVGRYLGASRLAAVGATTEVMPLSKVSLVLSGKVLKPCNSSDFKSIGFPLVY